MKTTSKPSVAFTGFVLLSFLVPSQASAALFSKVYVFGDSLSDTGRFYEFTGDLVPVSPPYAQKFSNGPLWVEYLQQSLGLTPDPATNFALAGATTGNTNIALPSLLTGVQQQVEGFLDVTPSADPDALYILWAGGDDYLGGQTNVNIPVNNLTNYITSLYGIGARNFLVPNLPDLSRLPNYSGSVPLSTLSVAHDKALASALNGLSLSLPNSRITPLNTFNLFENAVNNPSLYGFTNVTQACLPTNPTGVPTGPPCSNPNEYLFWDGIHPTTRSHQLISQTAFQALGIPEPSVTLSLLALGTLGAASTLKRKQKQKSTEKETVSSS